MRRRIAPGRAPCRGGGVLETLLVLALVAALVLIALDRFMAVRVQAERVAMEQVLQALRGAALDQTLHLNIHGETAELGRLEGSNPMLWLSHPPQQLLGRSWHSQPPRNYLGELPGPDPATIPGGQWYFDARDKMLVYRVEHEAYFETALPGAARARFKLALQRAATQGDGRFVPDGTGALALTITAVEPYRWRSQPVSVSSFADWREIFSSH